MSKTRIRLSSIAAALAMACAGSAFASPTIAAGDSSIFFNNFENLYRPVANCVVTVAPGVQVDTCLASSAVPGNEDPIGYRRANQALGGNVFADDVFVGILNVQNISSAASGSDTYNSIPGDRFTGYFAQRVVSATGGATGTVTLGTAVDPFGILAAGEMFRLYSDMPGFSSGGTLASSIASATTGGTFWGSLGLQSEGFAYTRTDLTVPINSTNTLAFLALDIMVQGPGYSAGILQKVNDFNETLVGGVITNPASQICTLADIANPGVACTDIVGTSEIEANNLFGTGRSPWQFASNDPFELNRVPEPGALALVGLALAALSLTRKRKV